ncbi:MFS transporter [Gandjariella thermophila]|uniref:Putative proline/betaine transporter n=1 Tax=Gandjariella thermophila TaxID=1931992 RepID=A0A4D4IWQ1_9PSEU|nr:MFS transporter [Gandjariella thermophila]GDY28621.1 MFS transporter [Gandjariella thermophila]
MAVQQAVTTAGRQRVVGNILRGSVGNLIEWYDWYAYTAFAVYFAHVFFPSGSQTAQLLNTAGVFAVGFFMRPLGGWLLGRYADRHGRRAALTLSVTLMAAGSMVITMTPSYRTIGVAAPLLLVAARLLQGISVGGEYSTSATYLSEAASPTRRGYYSSFQYVTLTSGQLLALAVQIVLQHTLAPAELADWGWRVAFALGALFALVVMYLRATMDESESFEREAARRQHASSRGTLRALLRHPRECLLVVGLTLGGTVAFYTYTTYLQKYMINTSGIGKNTAAWINFFALLVFVLLQPLAGAVSDRIGRRPLLLGFGIVGAVVTVPLLTALGATRDAFVAFGLMLAALVVVTGYTSINAVVKAELFPTRIRALGVGLPYAITVALFGGTAEYVALWLKQAGHESLFFWYVTGCILVSLLVYVAMRETSKGSPLAEDTTTVD